jgi:hypothetical protein
MRIIKIFFFSLLALGCSKTKAADRVNILLIISDDHGTDALPWL